MAINRRKNWGSTAQKIALKRAQEISARKRRGSGKKLTAKDYRAQGDKTALGNPGELSARERRTVRRFARADKKDPSGISSGTIKQKSVRVAEANKRIDAKLAAMKKPKKPTANNEKLDIAKIQNESRLNLIDMANKSGRHKNVSDAKRDLAVKELKNRGMDKNGDKLPETRARKKLNDGIASFLDNPSTTGSGKRGKDTKFDDLAPSEKKKLSSIADTIRKINKEIVGSKNMTYTADALQTFDNSGDPDAPGNDQTLQDFIDGIDEAIAEMDDLWQGSPEERSARKKLTTLKGEVQSMMLVSDGKSTEPPRAKANAPKASGGSKSAMGTADPATMSVGAIVKERKELLAKKREGNLSKEEASRLVAIQAESSLRTKNRKEGKGAGPTKVSMAKKEPAKKTEPTRSGNKPKKEILSSKGVEREWDSVYNVYAKIHNTGRAAKITVGKDGKIEIDFSNTNMAGNTLRPTSIMNALEKAGYRNTRLEGDKILAEVASSGDDSGPNVRNPFKGGNSIPKDVKGREINDDTDLTDLPDKDFNKIDDIRMEMSDVALDTLMRDNLVEEIDNAETVGQMMDAMQGLYLYLDEWDDMGRNTSQIRKKMDPLFEDLKKYSDRWPRS